MYLAEKLSAARIARAYGLEYKSPKVAESTILYHLKRNGIRRRDPAEHIRKVAREVEDGWVERYKTGESLKEIAGTTVSPVTVWNHLKKRGLVLRDKVEAQIQAVTKYERKPFDGDSVEKAYLMGLRYGDLDAVRHGRAIRVRVSTTHPAMADLFESLFSPYGYVHRYPREAKLTGYEWTLECDLDSSFEFLLEKAAAAELERMGDQEFFCFLAGLFDAEGCIYYHKKNTSGSFEWDMANSNHDVLDIVRTRLSQLGLHPRLRLEKTNPRRNMHCLDIITLSPKWRLDLWRFEEVRSILERVTLRHPEKVAKARIALRMRFRPGSHARETVLEEWERLGSGIRKEVAEFIAKANEELIRRSSGSY